jgi:Leucine-rich repeat (LRR) protein
MPTITVQFRNCEREEIVTEDVQSCLDGLSENAVVINISNTDLTSISNLSRFTQLLHFNCNYNQLTSLPLLPDSLELLDCKYNQLTSLPSLPRDLQYLDCKFNKLKSLPLLPSKLVLLDCFDNELTSLPLLPEGLLSINCCINQLISLPVLPNYLKYLGCSNNQLTSLPFLPKTLELLGCLKNKLTSLPLLPDSLTMIVYDDNPIHDNLMELNTTIDTVQQTVLILNRFRYLYYCLRYKIKFIQWFLKVNEAKIMAKTHPDKVAALLDNGIYIGDIDNLEAYL